MDVYSVSDTAEMLDVSEETVRRWIRDGKLKAAERNIGRSGNSLRLNDIVDFVNSHSSSYLDVFKKWLKKNNISYQKYKVPNKKKLAEAIKIAEPAAIAIAAATPLVPIVGPAVAFGGLAAQAIKEGNKKEQIVLLDNNETQSEDLTEKKYIEEAELSMPISVEENTVCPEDEMESTNPQKEIEAKILDEQMKLIQLRQEMAKITAEISICENQIEYYKLLLQK